MGISASSFYNSFGRKEALYCEASRSYLDSSGRWFFGILNDETTDTKTAFARLFATTAEEFTRGDHPLGCMISLAGTHCPPGFKQHPRHDGRASRLFGKRDGSAHPQRRGGWRRARKHRL